MADVNDLIEAVIEREGDYASHVAESGGATRWGIAEAVARRQGFTGEIHALPKSDAAAIYKRLYWLAPRFDAIAESAPKLAAAMFETGVAIGTGTATSFLQRALNALNRDGKDYRNLKVDRQIGAATLAALHAFLNARGKSGQAVLLKAIEALQGAHCLKIAEARPAAEGFAYGWLAERCG